MEARTVAEVGEGRRRGTGEAGAELRGGGERGSWREKKLLGSFLKLFDCKQFGC